MTALHTRARVLTARDAAALTTLVGRDRVLNCVMEARLTAVPDLDPYRLGGQIWGVDDPRTGQLRAALFHGGSLLPMGDDPDALRDLARQVSVSGRGCSSIVGRDTAVAAVWPALAPTWGRPRAIRANQPLLRLRAQDFDGVPADAPPLVRVAPDDLDRYLPASIAMFTEELGVSPLDRGSGDGYRRRVDELLRGGRAVAWYDERGSVLFKAEIGTVTPATAQIQGVWVRPGFRGEGVATAAMPAVLAYALQMAPTVSLYVNDFNLPARRLYERLGMRQIDTLSTVLL